MSTGRRRALAAMTMAACVAVGTGCVLPAARAATAAGTPAPTGLIALDSGAGVVTVQADGSGAHAVDGIANGAGIGPVWAPDGSRVMAGQENWLALTSVRAEGPTSPVTVGSPDTGDEPGRGGYYEDATYWLNGRYVIVSTGEEMYVGPSDGSSDPRPLLTDAQSPFADCDGEPSASPTGTVAFARAAPCGNTTGIWTFDPVTDTVAQLLPNALMPAYSPDGGRLAFSRPVDGVRQLFVAAADGTGAQQLTTDGASHEHAAWDPSGEHIAYDSKDPATGATTVKILDLSSGSADALNATGTKPSYQSVRNNILDRVYATGGITIDQAASRWAFDTTGAAHQNGLLTARSAVLVDDANATYAAPAISLAAEKQGPVVMTSPGSLDATAAAELQRTLPKGSTVYLVGNTAQLSSTVSAQVTALGYTALRMDGPDLPSISARVATQITKKPDWVFVADGMDYHDPVSASTAAASLGFHGLGVVLLVKGTTVPDAVKAYLNTLDAATTKLVTVGTTAREAMENAPLDQAWTFWNVSAATYEQTAVNLARFWWAAPDTATVESETTWQSAVAGNAVTATRGPALWTPADALSPKTAAYLNEESASLESVQTFGGNPEYSVATRNAVGDAIGLSSAYLSTVWAPGGVLPAGAPTPAAFPAALPTRFVGPLYKVS